MDSYKYYSQAFRSDPVTSTYVDLKSESHYHTHVSITALLKVAAVLLTASSQTHKHLKEILKCIIVLSLDVKLKFFKCGCL